MSIYIPNMEMPENCRECPMACGYAEPMYCGLMGNIPARWGEFLKKLEEEIRPSFCPLIFIPNHGRLIDADTVMAAKHYDDHDVCVVDLDDIEKAPTIIQADEESEND